MLLTVLRGKPTALSTPGRIFIDGAFEGFTLEPPPKTSQNQPKPYAVPAGRYKVALFYSDNFQTITPHVLDVPGFTAIEIHWGNFPRDTHGCLLVGKTESANFVGYSLAEFRALMEKLTPSKDDLWIEYQD